MKLLRTVAKKVHSVIRRFGWSDPFKSHIDLYRRLTILGTDSPNPWIQKSAKIPGWLFEGEHEFLWDLASRSGDGHILEVGSWMGKSTCILAGACAAVSPNMRVFCIDPFDMSGNNWQMAFHRHLLGKNHLSTFEYFTQNARLLGFEPLVIPIATISDRALPLLNAPLRMVFLDGTHEYDSVRRETELVLPHLLHGGVLAFHDATGDYPGVTQFVQELRMRTTLKYLDNRGTIVAFEKIN